MEDNSTKAGEVPRRPEISFLCALATAIICMDFVDRLEFLGWLDTCLAGVVEADEAVGNMTRNEVYAIRRRLAQLLVEEDASSDAPPRHDDS